jgi:hypothetical protein
MVRGTGIDLWRSTNFDDRSVILREVHYMKDGTPHGFEWWINDDESSVYEEKHWRNGCLHGIERQWNSDGKLRRGYPKYYVDDQKVTKRQYIRAAERDPSLPRWRRSENFPLRRFPAEITRHLGRRRKGA